MRCIRAVIAGRHPVILQGLSTVLGGQRDFSIVARCSDATSCVEAIRIFEPDITVLDFSMPDIGGLEILAIASAKKFPTRLVLFTASAQDRDLRRLAAAGAHAVIPQDVAPEILVQMLRQVADGQRLLPLSPSDQVVVWKQSAIADKGANKPRAPDHGFGIRRTVEQGNWAPTQYYRRHYQSASSSHLSEA